MSKSVVPLWRRFSESWRLLVIEHQDGSVEDCGFVPVVELLRVCAGEVTSAIEWKDSDGVPRTALLTADDYDDRRRLLLSHIVKTKSGVEIWHLDEAALIKIRRTA